MAVTNDGRIISASDDKILRVWDLESCQTLCTLEGHTRYVTAVMLIPQRGQAVSASEDSTATEAIKSLRKQKFDLMFLDLQLPDAPGDQVFETAKRIDADLNVIVITGYPDSDILDRILQVCPVTVLKKPLKVEQLYQTVKILGHSGPGWGSSEQQSSRLLVGL